MKMDYRRDLQHNYLVVETGEKTENYITRMMTENQVQGLLGSNLITTLLHNYCIKKNIGHKLNCMDFIIKPVIWLSISMLCCYLIRYIFSFCNSETRLYSYFSNGVCAVVLAGVFSFFFYTYWKNIKQF